MTQTAAAVVYRPHSADDAPALIDIAYRAFHGINAAHGFPPDFPSPAEASEELNGIFALPFVEGVVAEVDGRPVGSAFLWRLGAVLGIGPVTVDPETQAGGIGRGMMRRLLDRAEGAGSVRLVQAAFNLQSMSLYTKLGFDVREPLVCMKGAPPAVTIPGYAVRPATEADLPAACAVCQAVHGFDRGMELGGAIQRGAASVVEHNGRIVGYTTGIGFYGHSVAEGNDGMKALVAAAKEIEGPGMFVPIRNAEFFRWGLENGLKVMQPMTLMSLGEYQEPKGAFMPNILF
ncbi:MAG: GNAT family N-acetyltransferase [Fimbriimonas sp.]